jgi:hypothetical protein
MKRDKRASGLKLQLDARVPRLVCICLPVYGLVYCVSVDLCISMHAQTCMHAYVRAYENVSYA